VKIDTSANTNGYFCRQLYQGHFADELKEYLSVKFGVPNGLFKVTVKKGVPAKKKK